MAFEGNTTIDFKAYRKVNNPKKPSEKFTLKPGSVIASAASIKGNLADVRLTISVQKHDASNAANSFGKLTTKLVKDMKVVALKNGEGYDLVLRPIKK